VKKNEKAVAEIMELQWALMDIAVEWRGALDVRERG
jgi:hypothetical protein